MLGIVGTVPDEGLGILVGTPAINGDSLQIQGHSIPINRGTPALVASAMEALKYLGCSSPIVFLVGDIGTGKGSRALYGFLEKNLPRLDLTTLTFHYLQPDVDWHNKLMFTIEALEKRPYLIADAGYMYVAKMSGQAQGYDLFTPDIGELAFLADEEAPHPFYTRGFILHEEHKVDELIKRAYEYQNAAQWLLVKGPKDIIANQKGVHSIVDYPMVEELEPIGGTGDTLTGIVSALIESQVPMPKAAELAAIANRVAGKLSNPTPATQVVEIIKNIPKALHSLKIR